MALTHSQVKEYLDVLRRTGGDKEAACAARVIPPEYAGLYRGVEREELLLALPDIVPVRVIVSKAKSRKEGCPVHINMHGGGFVLPWNEDDDMYCARVACGIEGIVVDIDYAVSSEHPFPAALNQCCAVANWAFARCEDWHANPAAVSIGGHSAGGCLTEAICLKNAAQGGPHFCLQVLDYAASDNTLALQMPGPGGDRMKAFSVLYADGDLLRLKDPLVSPAFAEDKQLEGQPPALIIAPRQCPFYEVNNRYGMRLVKAGVPVTFCEFSDSRHGFTVRMLDEWEKAQETIVRAIVGAGRA